MIKYEFDLPDGLADASGKFRQEEFFEFMARAEGIQSLGARHTEAWQRTVLF